jgi:pimeloyl-ACP methyl ester carboxylesterase
LRRGWKIALGLLGLLAILLAVNTVTTRSQTKPAEVTAEGGQILELSRGAVQVTDSTAGLDAEANKAFALSQPIVLLHCYTCSLHWFDQIEPLLASNHRVIRIDLLGFGGSEKPESGYEIPAQAAMVAEAMSRLDVEGAMVVGNSMGGMVTASLAEQASQLVDRAVVIGTAPNTEDYGEGLPLLARLGYVPVLGEALWRITPDFAVEDAYKESFAPGFDVASGFGDPDQVLADYDAMTYTSFNDASDEADAYTDEIPLDERFKQVPVPLMVIFGAEDQVFDAQAAVDGYADVPGVQTEIVEDAGHAAQVEQPEAVAELLEGFALELEPGEARRAVGAQRTRGDRPDRPKGQDNRGKRDNRKDRQQ